MKIVILLEHTIMDITKWMIKKPDKNNNPVEPIPESGDTDCQELESVKAKKIKIDTNNVGQEVVMIQRGKRSTSFKRTGLRSGHG